MGERGGTSTTLCPLQHSILLSILQYAFEVHVIDLQKRITKNHIIMLKNLQTFGATLLAAQDRQDP